MLIICSKDSLHNQVSFYLLSHYHTIPTLNEPEKEVFGKHCGKEKMLVTSIFSFSHNVSYPSKSKFQFLSHDKINVTKELKFVLGRKEKIVGKGENADYQYFLLFPLFFQ